MLATARRELDKILGDFNPEAVEERKKMVSESSTIRDALQSFRQNLKRFAGQEHYSIFQDVSDVLTPVEIDTVLQLVQFEPINRTSAKQVVMYINKLIQNSYDAGFDQFTLNFQHFKDEGHYFEKLLQKIKAKPVRRLTVELFGYCGNMLAGLCENITVAVHGDVLPYAFQCSKNCSFYIQGNVFDSLYSFADESQGSTFYLGGKIERRAKAQRINGCIFKTPYPNTLETLLLGVDGNNRIILVHPDGHEEIKRDFNG